MKTKEVINKNIKKQKQKTKHKKINYIRIVDCTVNMLKKSL